MKEQLDDVVGTIRGRSWHSRCAAGFGWMTVALQICAGTTTGCVAHYHEALGYRSRQAVLRDDIVAFEALMVEAAESLPRHPLDNPKRTVFSHFLDFGGHDLFFPTIDAWRARGWVSEHVVCAIHRARWRGVIDRNPVEAQRAASVCLDEAREGSDDPDLRWKLEACLSEAPFLTQTATSALAPYIALAADPTEPFAFRAALLEGMTHVYLQDAASLVAEEPSVSFREAQAYSKEQHEAAKRRFQYILRTVAPSTDARLLGSATAFGAVELERLALSFGESFMAPFARESADHADVAWAWVRASKAKKKILRQERLGIWDRRREPAHDAYWYVCKGDSEMFTVLEREPVSDVEILRASVCRSKKSNEILSRILGPFPIEATARAAKD